MFCFATFFVLSVVAYLAFAAPEDKTVGKVLVGGIMGAISLWIPYTILWLLLT